MLPARDFRLRAATAADADTLALLSGELGYAADAATLAARLALLLAAPQQHFVGVAEQDGAVCGWIHAFVRPLLQSDTMLEIGGLVVASRCRGQGIGAALLAACESWALAQGLACVTLRSNSTRLDAHRFYQCHGYRHVKTSLTLRKTLHHAPPR